jgi:hypothetical protein
LTVTSTPYTETDMFGEIITNPDKYPRFSRHTVTIHDAVEDGRPVDASELSDLSGAIIQPERDWTVFQRLWARPALIHGRRE